MLISTRESPYELNPQIPHATQPRRGERWCLSMYTTRNATQADEEVKKALRKLRFPLSRRGESRTLGAVLHVGDDCDDMSFHREPHESPDDMSPTPCATTPQLHESTKPIECSVPDTSLHEPSGQGQGHVYVSTEDQGGVCLGLGGGLAVEGASGRAPQARVGSSGGAVGGGSAAEGQCIDPAAQLEEVEQDRTQDDLPEPGGAGLGKRERPSLGSLVQARPSAGDRGLGRGCGEGLSAGSRPRDVRLRPDVCDMRDTNDAAHEPADEDVEEVSSDENPSPRYNTNFTKEEMAMIVAMRDKNRGYPEPTKIAAKNGNEKDGE